MRELFQNHRRIGMVEFGNEEIDELQHHIEIIKSM